MEDGSAERRSLTMRQRVLGTAGLLLVYLIASVVPAPGARIAEGAPLFGPLRFMALGIVPATNAYLVVELGALLRPRWRALRTSGEAGRARLDRAVGFVTVLLAGTQAFAIGMLSAGSEGLIVEEGWASTLAATMLAGAVLAWFLARSITRLGLVNGFVVLVLVEQLMQWSAELGSGTAPDPVSGVGPWMPACALVLLAIAVFRVLSPHGPRGANTLSGKHFVALVPASSLEPLLLAFYAFNIIALGELSMFLSWGRAPQLVIVYVPLVVLTVTLSVLLQGPRSLTPYLERLGLSVVRAKSEARRLFRESLLATLPFMILLLTVEILFQDAFRLNGIVFFLVLATALAVDLGRTLATPLPAGFALLARDVRPERLPLLAARLGAEGIPSQITNLAQATLYRLFGAFVLAAIYVPEAHLAHATEIASALHPTGPFGAALLDADSDLELAPPIPPRQLAELGALAALSLTLLISM